MKKKYTPYPAFAKCKPFIAFYSFLKAAQITKLAMSDKQTIDIPVFHSDWSEATLIEL